MNEEHMMRTRNKPEVLAPAGNLPGLKTPVGYGAGTAPFAGRPKLAAAGWFAAGEDCGAGAPGLSAAGDCRAKTVRQLTTAVGDGAAAAVAACRYIDKL